MEETKNLDLLANVSIEFVSFGKLDLFSGLLCGHPRLATTNFLGLVSVHKLLVKPPLARLPESDRSISLNEVFSDDIHFNDRLLSVVMRDNQGTLYETPCEWPSEKQHNRKRQG